MGRDGAFLQRESLYSNDKNSDKLLTEPLTKPLIEPVQNQQKQKICPVAQSRSGLCRDSQN